MSASMPKFVGALLGKHLGRRAPTEEVRRRCIPLRNFLDLSAKPVPATDDYASLAQQALTKMMDNDREGCCVATTIAKMAGIQNAYRPGGSVIVATDAEVSKFYHAVGGPGDNGLVIADALTYLMTHGISIGGKVHKIDGFASVDVRDNQLLDAAFHWFGGIHIGVNLTNDQYRNADDTDVWQDDETGVVGGHSVPLTKRDGDYFTLATWGKQPRVMRNCVNDPKWCDEAYVIFGPDWFNAAGLDTNSVNVSALRAAFASVKAGGVPTIPDDPNPPPVPPTPPAPTTPGTWTGKGTMQLLGTVLEMELQGAFAQPKNLVLPTDWFKLLADAAMLFMSIRSKDWTGVATALAALLADLGVQTTAAERQALAMQCSDHLVLQALDGKYVPPRS